MARRTRLTFKQTVGVVIAAMIFYLVAPPVYLSYPTGTYSDNFVFIARAGILVIWLLAFVATTVVAFELYRRATLPRLVMLGCAILSYALTIYGFAVLYLAFDSLTQAFKPPLTNFVNAIYFSITTMATVGFGDFVPDRRLTRVVVALEILAGVGYSVFFFSIIAGFIREPTKIDPET
jgi:voltage-gated potassium channel